MMGPHAGQKIGLQLESHAEGVVFLLTHAASRGRDFVGDAELVLHVMTNFVSDHVGLGEFARRAKLISQLPKKAEVQIHAFIGRAIERANRGRGIPAGRRDGVVEQHQVRVAIRAAHAPELLAPNVLGVGQHDGHELLEFVRGRGRARIRSRRHRIALLRVEQRHRIDPECQGQDDDQQRAKSTADDHRSARHAAPIFNILAFSFAAPAHDVSLSEFG